MKHFLTGAVVLLLAGSNRAGDVPEPSGPSLDQLLPSDAFLYAAFDARALRDGLPGLDIAALLREPEMRQFLKPLLQALPQGASDDPVQAALAMSPLDDWLRGEAAFGFCGLTVEIPGADGKTVRHRLSPSHPFDARLLHEVLGAAVETRALTGARAAAPRAGLKFAVDFLLALEPGPALRAHVDEHLGMVPGAEVDKITLAGHDVTRLTFRAPGGQSTSVYADLGGKRWLIGGDAETVAQAIAAQQHDPLAGNERYAKVHARIATGHNIAFAYLNVAAALSMAKPFVAPIVLDELKLLGLDQFEGAAFAMGMSEGGVRESLLLALDGQSRGLCRLLDCLGQGFPSLQDAPATTVAFAGLRLDVERLRQDLLAFSQDVLPGSLAELQAALERVDIQGVNLSKTIVPAFGDELSLTVSPSLRSFIPDVVLQVALRDTSKFEQVLDLVKQLAAGHVSLQSFPVSGGSDGFLVRADHAEVQPAFAIRGNRLYGAVLGALPLKTYLANHVMNPAHETLGSSSETLAKVMRGLTGGELQPGLLCYLDLKRSLPVIYQSIAPMLPSLLDQSGTGLNPAYLPLAETLAAHFSGAAIGITRGPEGVSLDLFTPTGLLPLAMAAAVIEQAHLRGVTLPRPAARRVVQLTPGSTGAAN
ncbi:MAG: DUF3352 domain-containing protein [Planctomycetota bacterium]